MSVSVREQPDEAVRAPTGLERQLARLEADRLRHLLLGGPASREDVDAMERALGRTVSPAFRALLQRIGPGVFYNRHEVFGPHRLQIHDIELVPSLLSVRDRFAGEAGAGRLVFHRAEGALHAIELGPGPAAGQVISVGSSVRYPDLAAFLEAVVLP